MAKKCNHCGHDNDNGALTCVCGTALPVDGAVAIPATPMETQAPLPPKAGRRGFGIRNLVVLLWGLAFTPILLLLHSRLPELPLRRGLIAAAVFGVSALAAFLFLGRDTHRRVRLGRIILVAWPVLAFPQLFTIADGVAQEGWPTGRFNKTVIEMLSYNLALLVPAFLTGLLAMIKLPRVAAILALPTGLNQIITGYFLYRTARPITNLGRPMPYVLDLIIVGTKLLSYLTIPMGILLVLMGVLILRSAAKQPPLSPVSNDR